MKVLDDKQEVQSKVVNITFADVTSGLKEDVCALPMGAIPLTMLATIRTAFNGGAANTMNVGDDTSATKYRSALSLAAGDTAFTIPAGSIISSANKNINITPSFTTAPTTGEMSLIVTYVVLNRGTGIAQ